METTTLVAIAIAAFFAAALLRRAARVWRRWHGARLVVCPETGELAAVHIDLRHATTAVFGTSAGHPRGPAAAGRGVPPGETFVRSNAGARLADCSRWPERGRCDEPCIAAACAPESSVRTVAERWFASKRCVYCRKPIVAQFLDHYAALLSADGRTIAWNEIAPQQLPAALRTSWPVCWDCHIAETFRRQHPDLVTDR